MYCHKRCLENNDIFKWRGGGESDPFYNCPARSYFSFSLYHAGEQNALATPKIFISCYFQCLSGMNSEPTNPIQGAYSRFFLAHIVTTFTGPSVTFFCLPASHVLWADQDFALTFHGSFGTSATRALTNSELPELRHARELPQNIEVRNSAGTSWRLDQICQLGRSSNLQRQQQLLRDIIKSISSTCEKNGTSVVICWMIAETDGEG